MTILQIHLDNDLLDNAIAVTQKMGIDLSTAVTMFLRQMVKDNSLPFNSSDDLFYSDENIDSLHRSIKQFENGEIVTRTFSDLEAMAD